MDETEQKGGEMPDDEIYALLDRAMSDERLCVSEELIQRTMERINNGNAAASLKHKTFKRFDYALRYGCMAAAAVLLLVIGVRAVNAGNIYGGKDSEAAPENAQDSVNESRSIELMDAYRESRDTKKQADVYTSMANMFQGEEECEGDACCTDDEAERVANPLNVYIPEELINALSDAGYAPLAVEAECWEYVQGDTDRIAEIISFITEGSGKVLQRPQNGAYKYSVITGTGDNELVLSEKPLECIMHIDTEHGGIWCLFGDTLHIYVE